MRHFAISPRGNRRMVFRPQVAMIGCGVLLHIGIVCLCILLQAQSNRIWMWSGLVLSLVYTGFLWKLLLAWKVHFTNGGDSWESLFAASPYLPVVSKEEDQREDEEDEVGGGSSITHKSAPTKKPKRPATLIGNLLILLILINVAWIGLFVTLRQSMPHSCRGWTFLVHTSHAVSRTPLVAAEHEEDGHAPPTWELNNEDERMESMLQHDHALKVWVFTEALPQTTVHASKTTSSFGIVPATQTLLFAGKDPTFSGNTILWEQPSSTNEDALPIAHANVVSPTAFVPVNPTTVCFAQDNTTYPLGCFCDGSIRVVPPAFDSFSSGPQQQVVTSNLYASGDKENDLLWFQGYTLTTKGAYIASFNVTSGATTLHSHLVTPDHSNTSLSLVPPPLPQQQERYIPAASCSLVNNHRRHRFGSMASLWMGVPLLTTCVALWVVFWHNLLPLIPLATLTALEVLNLTLNAAVRPGETSFETGMEYGHVGLGMVGMTTVFLVILHMTEQKVIWMPTLVFATALYLIGMIEIFLGGERGYEGINWVWINLFAFLPLAILGYGVRLPGMTAAGLVGLCFLNAWKLAEVVAAHAKNDDAVFLVGYLLFAIAAWGAAKIYQQVVVRRSTRPQTMMDATAVMQPDSSVEDNKQNLQPSFGSSEMKLQQRVQLGDAWSDEEEETITLDNNL